MQGALRIVEDWCNVEGLRVKIHGRQLYYRLLIKEGIDT
jgi:hypothetical protein